MSVSLSFTLICAVVLFFFSASCAVETNSSTSQSIRDGRTLVSKEGKFELGFFSPGSSNNRYLGIWYRNVNVKTVVWVANRCNPISDSSGLFRINNTTGNLELLYQNKSVVWSTNLSKQAQEPTLELLDSGNLVLKDDQNTSSTTPEPFLWQSFDHPSDTFLPGMKLGWDLRTGLNRNLSAWKNFEDPCPGDLSYGFKLGPNALPEIYILQGTEKYYRSGPWNGLRFSGVSELSANQIYDFYYVHNVDEVYFRYKVKMSLLSRVVLNQTTRHRQRIVWMNQTQRWRLFSSTPETDCDKYNLCGANGNCSMISNKPVCRCLVGFTPKYQEKWQTMDWSAGCVRDSPPNCENGNGNEFVRFGGLKLPETTNSLVNTSMSLKECKAKCLRNCSCMAYSNSDISGQGSGCIIWFGDLFDIRQLPQNGQDLYIRNPASNIKKGIDNRRVKILVVVASIGVVLGTLFVYCICRTTFLKARETYLDKEETEDLELPLFDFATISSATDNFSTENKLGEGGFGPVYKGTLVDGQEIALKRLSRSSGQGLNEFKNEVILIAKLQHRNLVKLLGCCIQGEEKLLIYEYMPNKSLDFFIFDEARKKLLDWSKRFEILCGIARGILYLHQDSRLRIIHRDLKVSNVLLDSELVPKISDFGMAKTFGGNQTEGNTNRVVGTYGYMAPEYASDGLFSIKSDVFSFGILVLEIISGKKNRGFFHHDHRLNLTGHAWTLWKEGNALELIDESLVGSFSESEALRCIHIALLCVQQLPEDRPSMSNVVLMLGSQSALSQPKQPGFFVKMASSDHVNSSSSYKQECSSTNEVTITLLEAR